MTSRGDSGLLIAKRIAGAHPSAAALLLAFAALAIDFTTGRDIRFPLLYILPIGVAAWTGRKVLAYSLAIFMPVARVLFEVAWQVPEQFSVESVNASIEVFAMCLYAFLVGRQGVQSRSMKQTISDRDEELDHLRAFTRMIGTTLQGRSVSAGLADGVALLYRAEAESSVAERRIAPAEAEFEVNRFDRALAASVQEVEAIQKILEDQATPEELALVEVHLIMLNDPSLSRKCRQRIREDLIGAEQALASELARTEARLANLKHGVLRERAADVQDIGRRLLRNLRAPGSAPSSRLASLPPETIVVAEDLLLSDVLQMDRRNVVGIVTARTGPASHTAVWARSRRIPAVCGIDRATSILAGGDRLLVDGERATVTVGPTGTQAARFAARKAQSAVLENAAVIEAAQRCVTPDGIEIGLHANIGRLDEAGIVLEQRLDGVGLFRSEFLFLDAPRPPDEDAQFAVYSGVAAMLDPRPVVIRTMDFSGDKIPHFSHASVDAAVRGGLRGLALSLSEQTLFRTQLQAILRAAQERNVRVMFPMVMGVSDLNAARHIVEEILRNERRSRRPLLGAMIETPAAAFAISDIVGVSDFVCIGTNDLSHAILAIDRRSKGDIGSTVFLHPSVLRATDQVIRTAEQRGVPLSVCGEAAGDPAVACLLVGMGVRNISMSPFQAARVRFVLRRLTLDQAKRTAGECLAAATPGEIRRILEDLLRKTAPVQAEDNGVT